MPVVWLVRHGESQSNIGDLTYGPKETQLTEIGHRQAQEIVKAFSESPTLSQPVSHVPFLIITSEYKRSRQTAAPMLEAFSQSLKEQWPVHEFTYLSDDKTRWTTRQERCCFVQQFWDTPDPEYSDGEGAESFTQFITRVSSVIESLRYREEEFITIFTHGQFIQAMLWILETYPWQIDCTSKAAFTRFCRAHPIPTGAIQALELCGREEVHIGKLMTGHLSIINSYESCYEENLASPKENTSVTP